MTVGGFDSSLIDNTSNTTRPLRAIYHCRHGMIVEITQIVIHNTNGSKSGIKAPEDKTRACITPQYRSILLLPKAIRDMTILDMGGQQLYNVSGATKSSYYRTTLITTSSA